MRAGDENVSEYFRNGGVGMNDCKHDSLTSLGEPSMVEYTEGWLKYFSYKKYACDGCGKIVVILNAVVEKIDE